MNLSRSPWILILLLTAGCNPESPNQPPVAFFTLSPETGDTQTEFTLDATGSYDPEDPDSLLKIRWDYENDGIFDYPWVFTRINRYRFPNDGNFSVRLQVRDRDGLTADYYREVIISRGNRSPALPFMPNPPDSSNNILFNGRLSWVGLDPDEDSLTYDVYLGLTKDPPRIATGVSPDEYYAGNLLTGRKYSWRVISVDPYGAATTGPLWSFSVHSGIYETDSMTDTRDGQRYPTIRINRTWWLARNLNYDFKDESVCYDLDPRNCDQYGRLYSPWLTDTIVCPPGWRLPHEEDWIRLEMHLGMSLDQAEGYLWRGIDQATQLLEGGTSRLNLEKAGYREPGGAFVYAGERALYYSRYMRARIMMMGYGKVYRAEWSLEPVAGWSSVRCIRRY